MSAKSLKGRVFLEVAPLGQGSFLHEEVKHCNQEDFHRTVEAYITLNALQKVIEARLTAIKPLLHEAVESSGSNDLEVSIEGHRLIRERRASSAPDSDKLKALIQSRGLELTDAFDTVKTLVLNPSKLQFLIDTGKLSKADVEDLCKVTWAIKASPNEELLETFKEALALGNEDSTEKTLRKARKK